MRFPIFPSALLLATTATFAAAISAAPEPKMPKTTIPTAQELLAAPRVLVIAHRGYSAIAPENTLASFELAARAGADLIELDYYHSADEVPVVLHDKTLDRTTDAGARWGKDKLTTHDKTAAELATLDAGKWFSNRYVGTKLPTLSESIDLINRDSVTLIERKGGDAATLAKLLREKNAMNTVIVQAFDWNFLSDCHQIAPDLVLGALGPPSNFEGKNLKPEEKVLAPNYLDAIQKTGARVVGWNDQLTRESIDEAHRRGFKVWVYTINDVEKAQKLIALGVDGIISNDTPLIWKALALQAKK